MPMTLSLLLIQYHRPEKDHRAQLHAFHKLLNMHPEYARNDDNSVKLVLVGGSRNEGDANRIVELRELAKTLDIEVHPFRFSILFLNSTLISHLSHSPMFCSLSTHRILMFLIGYPKQASALAQ